MQDSTEKPRPSSSASAPNQGVQRSAKDAPSAVPSKPGRSRDNRSREAILAATRALANEHTRYREVSMERIAGEAKSSKATIYRWWRSKADLIREACLVDRISPAPGHDLNEDLAHLVREQAQVYFQSASAPIFAGTWAELVENKSNQEPEEPRIACPHAAQLTAMIAYAFERAVGRGQWEGPYQADAAYDIANGLLLYRIIGRAAKIDEQDIQRLVEHMLHAAKPIGA